MVAHRGRMNLSGPAVWVLLFVIGALTLRLLAGILVQATYLWIGIGGGIIALVLGVLMHVGFSGRTGPGHEH